MGPEIGDEGSGYWIGKEWLRFQGRLRLFNPAEVKKVAALTPTVIRRARKGEPIALMIIRMAQWELAKLVKGLAGQLRMKLVRLACAGSVFQGAWFRRGFLRALPPLRVLYQPSRTDSATALGRSIMGNGPR